MFFAKDESHFHDVWTDLCNCCHLLEGVEVVSLGTEELSDLQARSLPGLDPLHPLCSVTQEVASSEVEQRGQT